MNMLEYMETKTHTADILLAMLELTEEKYAENTAKHQSRCQIPRREICRWIKKNIAFISNAAYDARRNELISMGLITPAKRRDSIGGRGKDLILTEKGMQIARIVHHFVTKLEKAYSESSR